MSQTFGLSSFAFHLLLKVSKAPRWRHLPGRRQATCEHAPESSCDERGRAPETRLQPCPPSPSPLSSCLNRLPVLSDWPRSGHELEPSGILACTVLQSKLVTVSNLNQRNCLLTGAALAMLSFNLSGGRRVTQAMRGAFPPGQRGSRKPAQPLLE